MLFRSGKNLGPSTFSTIGDQKKTNYALQPQSKEEFVSAVTTGLQKAPVYFSINAKINQSGYDDVNEVVGNGSNSLALKNFKDAMKTKDVIIIDSRNADTFTNGFIPGSVSIGLEGRFAEWAGCIIPFDKPILLVTEQGKEKETATRLARVGFDKMLGCLKGGYEAWQDVGEKSDMIKIGRAHV